MVTTVTTYFAALKIGHYGEISAAYIKENKAKLTKEERKAYKAGMKGSRENGCSRVFS